MINLKIFEEYTNSRIGKKHLLPFRIHDILEKITLWEILPKIYAVKISDVRVRAFLFLRYQEFYESPSKEFRMNKFKINDYINWYMENTKNKDLFTYSYDWLGFNIPSTSIEECLLEIKDKNEYDQIMSDIIDSIRWKLPNGNFYLLGVDSLNSDLMDHEMCHGLYFTNKEYRKSMDEVTNNLPKDLFDNISNKILDIGYDNSVVKDEIQAYISTGLIESMEDIPNIKKYIKKYKSIYLKYSDSNPQEIKITWE